MKGNTATTKIHFQGTNTDEDYVIFVESAQAVKDWKADKSIPLAQVVSGWKIFITHKQGNQGILDGASNAQLDSEFGTHKEEDVVQKIIESGSIIENENNERQGDTNITKGGTIAH